MIYRTFTKEQLDKILADHKAQTNAGEECMTPRLEKLTAALSRPQHTLSPDAEDADWAYWNGKREAYESLSPIHSALKAVVEAAERIRDYAVNIEINHPDACAHGNGYSLLGQLAQQTSTDLGETLAALDSELAKLEGRG